MTCTETIFDGCQVVDIPHCYLEGDELPEWHFAQDDQDLTGYTIKLILEQEDGTVVEVAATETDYSVGQFFFRFSPTDLTPCQVLATLTADDPGGLTQTLGRFRIQVKERPTP